MFFGAAEPLSIESIESKTSKAPTVPRKRVIWLQNSADHYFAQMLDALNAQGDVEYFGVFLCPPPAGGNPAFSPRAAPHAFLGDSVRNAGPEGHRSLGRDARSYIRSMQFAMAIVGGYDSRFKRWMIRYCRGRGIPIVLIADSNIRSERGRTLKKVLKRRIKRILLRPIIRDLSAVIPCNCAGVAYWRYYGCPVSKIARSTYLCTVDIPAALAIKRDELFARYQLDPNCKLIFTAARLVPAKALHLMVEAFAQSGLAEKGWVWAVAGTGPLRQELEKLAAERSRHAGSIRFLGAVAPADIPPLMAQSELFVLPSVHEPHGIVVEESIAVGTPVIAADTCGAALDLVRTGRTGWFFKAGNAASLRSVVESVGQISGTLRAMRPRCQAEFVSWYGRYSPTIVVPKVLRRLAISSPADSQK